MSATRQACDGTLILGGGFAGGWVARYLGRSGATIVSPDNFMLYTPILPEAASGTVEPRHVVVPLRLMCPHAELLLGRVVGLDEAARTVEVESEVGLVTVAFDRLVVAIGAVSRVLPVPGLVEHAVGFKTLADAIQLRNHVLRQLEAADAEAAVADRERHLTFVFVGAGYAGVEALAELRDLVRDALRHYPRLRAVRQRWLLVDAAPAILPEIPRRLGSYAMRHLERQGIELRVSTTLAAVGPDSCTLSDGSVVPTRTVVWTAGVRAHPLLADLGLPLDERGRVRVDSALRVVDRPAIWALGDCAAVPNLATPDRLDPPTCQHALRQARRLARNIERERQGRPVEPYRYRMLGQVATLGRYKGIADALGVQLSGFAGWWTARTYHLIQLPLPSRKLRLVADWTTSLFFRRDIAELGTLGRPHRLDDA